MAQITDPPKWPVPELDSPIPRATLDLQHDDFKKWLPYWQFWRHSDEQTGGYAASTQTYTTSTVTPSYTETYLIPHIKEYDPNMFARRVASAKPPRFVKEGIESITGVLTQQQPNRDNYPPKLDSWTGHVNSTGDTLQEMIATDIWPLVERYGVVYTLAKRPEIDSPNMAEQERLLDDAGLPEVLLVVISPENMPWWETDDFGRFTIVRYTEERTYQRMEDGYPTESLTYQRHWWITKEGWWFTDDDAEAKGEGETGLSVGGVGYWNEDQSPMKWFPVSPWELKDRVPPTASGSFAQLMYFRKDSELDLLEKNTAFAMTYVPSAGGDEDPEESIKGPHQIASWDPTDMGGAKPMILETTGVSLTHLAEKRLPELEAEALAPYGRQREVGGNDSGVALAHIQESAKNIYRQHSKAGGKSEYAALQPVAELLDEELTTDGRASWPRKFGVLADSSHGELLTSFWEKEPGDDFKEHILNEYSDMLLDLTGEQLQAALEEWRKAKEEQERKEQEQLDALMETEPGEDGDGPRRDKDGISVPFAGNPASQAGPDKGAKP